jgi:hypothetical protein
MLLTNAIVISLRHILITRRTFRGAQQRPLTGRPNALCQNLSVVAAQTSLPLITLLVFIRAGVYVDIQLKLVRATEASAANFTADRSSIPGAILRHGGCRVANLPVPAFITHIANPISYFLLGRMSGVHG